MAHKKPRKYRPGKRQMLVTSKWIIPIEAYPSPGYGVVKKPTLHAKGGLAGMRRFNRGGKVK